MRGTVPSALARRAPGLTVLAAVLLAHGGAAAQSPVAQVAGSRSAAERVAEILRERAPAPSLGAGARVARADAEQDDARAASAKVAGLARELARLGPEALPALFEELAARSPSADPAAGSGEPGRAADGAREALLSALCELPFPAVRAHVARSAAHAAPPAARCAALDFLARAASAADVELCTLIARPVSPDAALDDSVAAAFEHALRAILLRDRGGFGPLGVLLHGLPTETGRAAIRGAAETRTREGLAFLARQLDREPGYAICLMAQIGRMGMHAERPVDPEVLTAVRRRVSDPDSPVLSEAILAAGWLDEFESIPALIERLDDRRPGVRADALWSLQRMTGLKIAGRSGMWTDWHEAEALWWREDWPGVQRDVHGPDPARAMAALIAIAPVRTFRHKLALEIAPLLAAPDVEVATLAARMLGQLRSPAAVPALIGGLERDEGDLRLASWSSLKSITAQSLPADASAWRTALPSR